MAGILWQWIICSLYVYLAITGRKQKKYRGIGGQIATDLSKGGRAVTKQDKSQYRVPPPIFNKKLPKVVKFLEKLGKTLYLSQI